VFLDVGANIGYMSLLGARAVGKSGVVVAIEPEARNLALLRANLWRNGMRATVFPIAAYSSTGFLPLVLSDTNPGDHQVRAGASAEVLVPCARLDELLGAMRVDVAKVDTQGTDHEVIAGMQGLIGSNPALIILAEFWLAGMEERSVDPELVLADYRKAGFGLGLLAEDGNARPASDREIVAACEAWEGRYVNLVLHGPRAPAR
jgi:FkbM family methyltransferase